MRLIRLDAFFRLGPSPDTIQATGCCRWDVDRMGQRYSLRSRAIVGFTAAIRELKP